MSTTCSDGMFEHFNCDLPAFQGKSFTRPAPECCTFNEIFCSKGPDGKYSSCTPKAFSCQNSYEECTQFSNVWYAKPSSTTDPAKPVAAYLPTNDAIYSPTAYTNNLTCCPGNYVYKLGPWKANTSTI